MNSSGYRARGWHVCALGAFLVLAALCSAQDTGTRPAAQARWGQFLRHDMMRYNPNETTLGVNNVSGLELKWQTNAGFIDGSSPVVEKGVLYIGVGGLSAFDIETGEELWSYATSGVIFDSPAVENGIVYVGDGNGYVYAVKADTGDLLWRFRTSHYGQLEIYSSPTVVGGVVYIGAGVLTAMGEAIITIGSRYPIRYAGEQALKDAGEVRSR